MLGCTPFRKSITIDTEQMYVRTRSDFITHKGMALEESLHVRSSIQARESRRPNREPCGAPDETGGKSDSFTETH